MGGSFNPPHNGHVYIAREVRRRFSLDRVLFMVAGDPPHKSIAFGVDAKERLELTRAALAGEEGLIVCDDEIRRGGVSYMADTLMGLYNGVDELHLIVGADMLKTLHQWRKPETIFALAGIIAVGRPDNAGDYEAARELRRRYGARIRMADFCGPDISSTEIRRRVNKAKGIAKIVPYGVMERIYAGLLYQSEDTLSYEKRLAEYTKPKRLAHSIGTMGYAVELAAIWGADGKKARIAGLLHDCAKLGREETVRYAEKMGYALTNEERENPFLIHSRIGALLAKDLYGVQDTEILNAIERHTVGCAEMTPFDEVIFLADKLEQSRDYRRIRDLRELAFRDLDRATIAVLRNTIEYTENKGMRIHPQTEITIAALEKRVKARLHGGD